MKLRQLIFLFAITMVCSGCSYLKYSKVHANYAKLQKASPSQRNLKHMLERDTFAIMGETQDSSRRYQKADLLITAYSHKYQPYELVASMQGANINTHFGLNLPEGHYQIIALADINGDGVFDQDEAIGQQTITLNITDQPDRVATDFLLPLTAAFSLNTRITIPATHSPTPDSIVYPGGTIRQLDDPIFSQEMSTVGLYDPAAFFDQIPTMFHTLEEDIAYKVPVIFVHGISGSAREFQPIIDKLDRRYYKPWFFHYPSGGDLDHMGEMFFNIFLSGDIIPTSDIMPTVIVAHSMGGLVVRQALNQMPVDSNHRIDFISLASPFSGHPAAEDIEKASGLILPSWRDLAPSSIFIQNLFQRPLPDNINHHLLYAYNDGDGLKMGDNSDGVVPLSSQLAAPAQLQASEQLGLNVTHTSILTKPEAISAIISRIESVKSGFPEDHLAILLQGGFHPSVNLSDNERYYLGYYGCYLQALSNETLKPFNEKLQELVEMLQGKRRPSHDAAKAWIHYKELSLQAQPSDCKQSIHQ